MYETKHEYMRVMAETPGKHGEDDYRVSFNGKPLKDGEILALVGFKLLAEDRYDEEGQLGRDYFIRRLYTVMFDCTSPEQILNFSREVDDSK